MRYSHDDCASRGSRGDVLREGGSDAGPWVSCMLAVLRDGGSDGGPWVPCMLADGTRGVSMLQIPICRWTAVLPMERHVMEKRWRANGRKAFTRLEEHLAGPLLSQAPPLGPASRNIRNKPPRNKYTQIHPSKNTCGINPTQIHTRLHALSITQG
eukprot:84038-Chlamydomonas_euryale.AAC.4